MPTLWTCAQQSLPPHNGKGCPIHGHGPLFDLAMLQALLRSGELDLGNDHQCWIGTNKCYDKLIDLKWTPGNQVTKLLCLLKPGRRPMLRT